MKKIIIFLFILIYSTGNLFSQPQINLQKYWRFRERVKNFLVPGNCFGCSLPAKDRGDDDRIEWSDGTIHLGYYIGMLATEHRLLSMYNQSPTSIKETEKELYFALETINRLDLWAEFRWEEFALGINHNGQTPPFSDLNGFFIRDDIPFANDFFSQIVEGKTVREQLNSSMFPLPGGYHLSTAISGYTVGLDEGYGPREETQDQVIQLYTGLALISKLIDQSVIYTDDAGQSVAFMDGETSILQEAKNISNRITSHIQQYGWTIVNPVMPDCVQGVCGNRSCLIGACGGGNVTGLCYGFYLANCYIQHQGAWCNSDGQTNGNSLMWSTTYRWNSIGAEDFKVLTLAAIGHPWSSNTNQVIVGRCAAVKAEHLPLLYAVLYDDATVMLPKSYYTEMMDDSWCTGNNGYEGPVEWRGQSRILYGTNTDATAAPVHFNNIDYMLFFNMYAIAYPDYLNGQYKAFSPQELCEKQINEKNIVQLEQRNLYASSGITLEDYQTSPSSALNLSAGREIEFRNGTEITIGSRLTAVTDSTLKNYGCTNFTTPVYNGGSRLKERISIYPNPSAGVFEIEVVDPPADGKIAIYNASGQKIFQVQEVLSQQKVDLKTNGLYIIRLEGSGLNISQKVVVAAN